MAFVSNTYEEYPLFIAKLCAPIVSSMYHDVDPGLYMIPRVIALWLNITLIMHIAERGVKPTEHDWRSNILSSLWGDVNYVAATQYQLRIEKTTKSSMGVAEKISYDLARSYSKHMWSIMRSGISTLQSTYLRRFMCP